MTLLFPKNVVLEKKLQTKLSTSILTIYPSSPGRLLVWKNGRSPALGSSLEINFDIAIRDSFSVQGIVCCDSSGKILMVVSQISPLCDPTYGEALAAAL